MNLSITTVKKFALGKDLIESEGDEIQKASLKILNSVSLFLFTVNLLFLFAFQINSSVSLSWFFLGEATAFLLIPFLARQGYQSVSKYLLIIYINVGIIILSTVFGANTLIQAFFIPTMGLSLLLFGNHQLQSRNITIAITALSFLVLDYVIFDRIYLSSNSFALIRWSVLLASFITTWLIFNTFSEYKERAEVQTLFLLKKEQKLNQELQENRLLLEEKIQELSEAGEELKKGARAKSDFLATMSHEIRTPMNAILGMTNLLMYDAPREDQKEQIEILDFSAKTLLAIIDDVLDFSKIEAGKIEFENIPFSLDKLIKTIVTTFKVSAEKKGIKLNAKIGKGVPKSICGDPSRLTQILNNLLSNALKFTEKGSVELEIKLKAKLETSATLIFEVKDTGIGIEEDRLETIFNSFTQAKSDTKRLFGGTGLGLTISRELVQRQGGKIWVQSTPGKGSTFSVELEFGLDPKSDDLTIDSIVQTTEYDLTGLRVLMAEDNVVNQKVMQRFLERWKVELTVAENGEEVVEMANNHNFDVILMDLQMPVMDGYEAAEAIRKLENSSKSNTPIIALTAAALKEVKEKVYASGMNDFITKPFNPAELQQKLEKYKK